jgi:hypothetical protein
VDLGITIQEPGMRSFCWILLAAISVFPTLSSHSAAPPAQDDSTVLAAARQALGGEQRLAGVKTMIATGRTRQLRGDNLVPIEFEILFEAPDKYLRKDEIPAQESGPTTSGFNGEELVVDPPPPPPPPPPPGAPAGGPPPDAARRARVMTLKQDFARLALGLFATSFSAFPLTFSSVGVAEAPQGKADVIEGKAAPNFAVRLFVLADTHLPVMLSWTVPATNVVVTIPGQPPPASLPPGAITVEAPPPPPDTAPKEERDKYAQEVAALRKKTLASAKPIEHRLYLSDYRAVDGIQLPFRLRRAVAGQTIEETTFDRFRINGKIDPRRFEVRK